VPIPLSAAEVENDGGHAYRVHRLDANTDWLAQLAQTYVALRTECAVPITTVSLDGVDFVDGAGVLARLTGACLPFRRDDNFDVVRSDMGETLAYAALEQSDGTSIGCKSVRDRELRQAPGRGIDVVGVEPGPKLTLVLGEVKVSDEAKCPPKVVDKAKDGLRKQHLAHMADRQATADKIWDQSRRVNDAALRDKLFASALLFENERWDQLRVVACCVLVRSNARYAVGDLGSFRSSPADYAPADVRFIVITTPDAVEATVKTWHGLLKQAQEEAA
jgi:hypothetical protein